MHHTLNYVKKKRALGAQQLFHQGSKGIHPGSKWISQESKGIHEDNKETSHIFISLVKEMS